jgi:hypothetical protein
MQRAIECPICGDRSPDGDPSFQRCQHSDAEWAKYQAELHEPEVFYHSTPMPDACAHDFQGWEVLKDDYGRECGGTTVCTKCGMDAMSYSLRMGD